MDPRIADLSMISLADISLQKTAKTASVMSSICSYKTARGARSSNSHSAKHPEALPLDEAHRGGGLLRSRYVTAIERHCRTESGRGDLFAKGQSGMLPNSVRLI